MAAVALVKGDGAIVVGVALAAVAVVGLVWWGRSGASSPAAPRPAAPSPLPEAVGPFPDLRVGTPVLVDAAAAQLPASFSGLVPAIVDQILRDPFLVSVRAQSPSGVPFAGTIARSSIVQVLPSVPPGLLQT